MQVKLSQDDLKVVLRILMENLGEAGGPEPAAARQETSLQVRATGATPTGPSLCSDIHSLNPDICLVSVS